MVKLGYETKPLSLPQAYSTYLNFLRMMMAKKYSSFNLSEEDIVFTFHFIHDQNETQGDKVSCPKSDIWIVEEQTDARVEVHSEPDLAAWARVVEGTNFH